MSDEITNGAVAPTDAATGPAFTVEKIYVKDVSFESPNAPGVFHEAVQPHLPLNLDHRVQRLRAQHDQILVFHVWGVQRKTRRGEPGGVAHHRGLRVIHWPA